MAPFLLALAVIGLNLFIALLSYTFQNVQDHAFEYSILEHVRLPQKTLSYLEVL